MQNYIFDYLRFKERCEEIRSNKNGRNLIALPMMNRDQMSRACIGKGIEIENLVYLCNKYHWDIFEFLREDTPFIIQAKKHNNEKWTNIVFQKEIYREYGNTIERLFDKRFLKNVNLQDIPLKLLFTGGYTSLGSDDSTTHKDETLPQHASYVFRYDVFEAIPRLTGLSKSAFGKNAGHLNFYNEVVKHNKRINVNHLIDACNANYLDINDFFGLETMSHLPNKLQIDNDHWKNNEFHSERFKTIPTAENEFVNHTTCLAQLWKLSKPNVIAKVKGKQAIYVDEILKVCNEYDIVPSYFFNEPMTKIESELLRKEQEKNLLLGKEVSKAQEYANTVIEQILSEDKKQTKLEKEEFVYIFTNPGWIDDGKIYVKIGATDNIQRRLKDMSTSNLYDSRAYAYVHTKHAFRLESSIKIILKLFGYRARDDREFFYLEPEDAFKILSQVARNIPAATIYFIESNGKVKKIRLNQ